MTDELILLPIIIQIQRIHTYCDGDAHLVLNIALDKSGGIFLYIKLQSYENLCYGINKMFARNT